MPRGETYQVSLTVPQLEALQALIDNEKVDRRSLRPAYRAISDALWTARQYAKKASRKKRSARLSPRT